MNVKNLRINNEFRSVLVDCLDLYLYKLNIGVLNGTVYCVFDAPRGRAIFKQHRANKASPARLFSIHKEIVHIIPR